MANKGDERKRMSSHSTCGVFRPGTPGQTVEERQNARRDEAVLAARRAIGAVTAEEAAAIMKGNPADMRKYLSVLRGK